MSTGLDEGEFPSGWESLSLSDVCLNVSKIDPLDLGRNEFKYIDIGSIDSSTNSVGSPQLLKVENAPGRARQLVRSGDSVFSTVRPYLRNIAYVDENLDGEIASTGFCVLRPNQSKVLPRFIRFFSISDNLLEQVLPLQRGVSYPAVRDKEVLSTKILVPPQDEQEKIVEILGAQLSRLDAALASVRAVREKSGRLRRSLLNAAFTGALTGADSENSNTDVRVSVFEDLFDLISNDRRQVKQKDYKKSGRFPVVDQGEETVGGFIDDGDLLFDGALPVIVFGDHTRRFKFIDFPFVVGADGTKLIQCKEVVLPRYGFYHLEAADFRNRGYARHFGELKKVMFWLPSIQLQEKIVEILEEQFLRLEASLAVADVIEKKALALRRSLLHAAFTGNLTKEWREGAHV